MISSLSDRHTSDKQWIDVCQNAVFSKIYVILTTIILHDLDLLLKIQHQELVVWCLANNFREK